RNKGLKIPIIYNSSGYENVETLKKLEGYINVYLPDFKYFDNEIALKYSGIKDYYEKASSSIKEMYRQVGPPKFNENQIIQNGMIIRHLILPNNIKNTKSVLKWIKENIGKEAYISIMAQYFPTYKAKKIESLNRKITKKELEQVEKYIYELDFENGYIQELGKHEEEYVPKFDM
ncbi:MAG: radical SAM protein, partial [Clostridia bacterium]